MFTLQHIADADSVDWDALYPRAVATSCDWVLERSAERVAACDEPLARTPGQLPSLGILAMFTQLAPVADGYADALARETGALLRLLDRALAAHGRDRLALPERLADTIGPLLALYAATCDAAP